VCHFCGQHTPFSKKHFRACHPERRACFLITRAVSNKLETLTKESVVAQFEVIAQNLHERTETDSVKIVGLRDEISTENLQNTKYKF
jgi:hypothetical protein